MARKFALIAAALSAVPLARPAGFASGVTRLADLIVPEVYDPYVRLQTEEKSRLVRSGAVVSSSKLASLLAGGGSTFNAPFLQGSGQRYREYVDRRSGHQLDMP